MNEEEQAKQKLTDINDQVEKASDDVIFLCREILGKAKTKSETNSTNTPETILDACETVVNNKAHNEYIYKTLFKKLWTR